MKVQRDGRFFTVEVTADGGEGLVSHAGAGLLAEVTEETASLAISTPASP